MAPTYVAFVDNTIDISQIHASTEEEKKNTERFIAESENQPNDKIFSFNPYLNGFYKKLILATPAPSWSSIYFKINSPPPEIS